MAEAKKPEDNKESTVALEDLKSSLESATEKFDTSLTDINSRLDDFGSKIDNFETPPSSTQQTLAPETEGHVPKDWTPRDWNEVYDRAEELADKKIEARFSAYQKEYDEQEEEKKAKVEADSKFYDDQEAALEKQGLVPKIENPGDKDDPGKVARREIYNLGLQYGSNNLVKMAALRDRLKETPPTGANAPVGSSSTTTEAPSKVPSYDEIHSKSLDELAQEDFPK